MQEARRGHRREIDVRRLQSEENWDIVEIRPGAKLFRSTFLPVLEGRGEGGGLTGGRRKEEPFPAYPPDRREACVSFLPFAAGGEYGLIP